MTDLRQAAQQALEALYEETAWFGPTPKGAAAITALKAALAEPVQERNFCPRCGKRTNDIHTCTPPVADGDNLSPTGCDHCRHVLYAAIKCSQCGRVTE